MSRRTDSSSSRNRLSGAVGPERLPSRTEIGWFRRCLRAWFSKNGRDFPWRTSRDPYMITVAEIFLQQTAAPKVASFLRDFLTLYPGWDTLAKADLGDLEQTRLRRGLQRRRSRVLKRLGEAMMDRNGLPRTREDLEALPGVGQYVASAVLAATQRKREPLLDTNMARVLERFFGPRSMADIRYDPYLQRLSRRVIQVESPLQLNWAILDFAAAVCTARNPRCTECPLLSRCVYATEG